MGHYTFSLNRMSQGKKEKWHLLIDLSVLFQLRSIANVNTENIIVYAHYSFIVYPKKFTMM